MTDHLKLFIPGPVEVHPDVLKACSVPMISHRAKEYEALHARTREKLKQLLHVAAGRVFLFTSSATGAMESSVRNLSTKRILSCTCGAFSERWFEIARENGRAADAYSVEWGRPNRPEEIDRLLATGKYDALMLVHNETSTGLMNPLKEIAEVARKHSDVMFCVDAVSSMAGVDMDFEALGIDLLFAGVQKAFGLPPGLTVAAVSPRALKKAAGVPDRGHYFDLVQYQKYDDKNQTPETPAISLVHALDVQLDRMMKEGFQARFARTRQMAETCRAWAREQFALFPEAGYESVTLTAIRNTKGINVGKLNAELAKRGVTISEGYGKIKDQSFRIAHMADITMTDLTELLNMIDEILKLGLVNK
ncbi:MAG TPA: alanine--glyoxylate aminotransferase family protein [Planctomycetota bacterium]|nr:alanine--glyoxylate aminotransferase family protein [Planctomycetota bacterium]